MTSIADTQALTLLINAAPGSRLLRQVLRRDENPVLITIDPVSRFEAHAAELHWLINDADSVLAALGHVDPECLDAEVVMSPSLDSIAVHEVHR